MKPSNKLSGTENFSNFSSHFPSQGRFQKKIIQLSITKDIPSQHQILSFPTINLNIP